MHAQLVQEPGFHPGTVKTRTELGAIPLLLNLPDLVTLLFAEEWEERDVT